jgi:hypothetical protein
MLSEAPNGAESKHLDAGLNRDPFGFAQGRLFDFGAARLRSG